MKLSIILLIVICGLTNASIRQHFYVNSYKTWPEAQKYCRTYYTDLSTISSQEEQNTLVQLAGRKTFIWIGLYRNVSNKKQFLWSDGSSLTFSNWKLGEPSNSNAHQTCVVYSITWINFNCNSIYAFFCYNISFTVVKEKKTWEEALLYCRSHYSGLASLTTDRQLQLAKEVTVKSRTESVWTGLRFLLGEWFWVNSKTLLNQISLPECPAQPYYCGAHNTKTDKWENRDCGEKLNFLCM